MVGRTTIGWGVVGCGWVARDYAIPAIEASRNGRLVALCDSDAGALSRLGRPHVPQVADLDALLRRDDIDALYVATPNHAHLGVVATALRRNIAVLCEKPLAHDLADARGILAAVRSSRALYATAFDQRFHAAHRMLRDLVSAGQLGTVSQARMHYACWVGADWAQDNWRVDAARSGGGALVDLAPHCIDLMDWLIGAGDVEIHAFLQNRVHAYAVDDGAVLTARWANDAIGSIHVAYNCPEQFPRRRIELVGTKAMAVADNTMGQTPGGTLTLVDAADGASRRIPLVDDRSPFLTQVEAFADACLGLARFPFAAERDLLLFEGLMAAAAAGGRQLAMPVSTSLEAMV